MLAEFTRLHPEIRFELEITDRLIDLLDERMDLAIRVQEPEGADFVFKRLFPNDLVLCASPIYLKKAKPLRTLDDLCQHPILALKVYEDCRFKNSNKSIGDLMNSRAIICESGVYLTELAIQGAGIAIRSTWDVGPLIKAGQLVQVLPKQSLEPYGTVYAVVPTRRLLANRVRAFMDFLVKKAANT